jgi:DNA-binding transcriptional LysR family regulator
MRQFPDIAIDLHLSDAMVDVIGEGFDLALRIGELPDSSLLARRLAQVRSVVVAAPAYLDRFGRPVHPSDLAEHDCIGYAYLRSRDAWEFFNAANETVTVRPNGRLRVNNGEAALPSAIAGMGIVSMPAFMMDEALADGRLERILPDWSTRQPSLYLVSPPGGPRPARIAVLAAFLTERLSISCPGNG